MHAWAGRRFHGVTVNQQLLLTKRYMQELITEAEVEKLRIS